MLLGCLADDFTGASDLAGALARTGMRTSLVMSRAESFRGRDAIVIPLKTRSIAAADAVAKTLEAFHWLKAQGAQRFYFKYCSTFDSTPAGNIGPVAEALARELDVRAVVACPALPANGRTVYQGHLFVHDQLLSESGMQNHPLTPMTDPDLRRWLTLQTKGPVGHVPLATIRTDSAAVRQALSAANDKGQSLIIVDALDDTDIGVIGAAVDEDRLVTGGSALGAGIAESLKARGSFTPRAVKTSPVKGPAAVLAGSCSTATRAQIEAYEADHPALALDVAAVIEGRLDPAATAQALFETIGRAPLCHSSGPHERVAAIQQRYGREKSAMALDRFFGTLAVELLKRGLKRLVVAGGETSGAVVEALNPTSLDVGAEIDPGVPALSATIGGTRRALTLKSGNFGGRDFFTRAVRALGADA